MQDTPPRRSRPKPPKGGRSLPFVPLIVGVVILGFVIGAGLSVAQHHGPGDAVASATSSPLDEPTAETSALPTPIPFTPRKPLAQATPAADETETPAPSPKPSASLKAGATHRPQAQPSKLALAPNVVPSVSPSAAQVASAPTAAPSEAATAPAPPVVRYRAPTASPAPEMTAVPETLPPATAPAAAATAVLEASGDFSRLAGNVVRQYLLALARGDTDSAYAALGDGPGSHASVPEAGAIDSSMRIQKISAVGSESAATVNVDVLTASGPYSGQYTVHKSATGAAIIVSHTFGKP